MNEQGRSPPVHLLEERVVTRVAEMPSIALRLDADAIELEDVDGVGQFRVRGLHVVHRHAREGAEAGGMLADDGGERFVDGPRLLAPLAAHHRLGHAVDRQHRGLDAVPIHHGDLFVDRPPRQRHGADVALVHGLHHGRNQRVAMQVDDRIVHCRLLEDAERRVAVVEPGRPDLTTRGSAQGLRRKTDVCSRRRRWSDPPTPAGWDEARLGRRVGVSRSRTHRGPSEAPDRAIMPRLPDPVPRRSTIRPFHLVSAALVASLVPRGGSFTRYQAT